MIASISLTDKWVVRFVVYWLAICTGATGLAFLVLEVAG